MRIRLVQNAISCHKFSTVNLDLIVMCTVPGGTVQTKIFSTNPRDLVQIQIFYKTLVGTFIFPAHFQLWLVQTCLCLCFLENYSAWNEIQQTYKKVTSVSVLCFFQITTGLGWSDYDEIWPEMARDCWRADWLTLTSKATFLSVYNLLLRLLLNKHS